jgi:hypothetical protein
MAEFPLLLFKVAAKATSSSLKTARAAAARKEMHVDRLLLPGDGVDVVRCLSPDDVPLVRAALIFFEEEEEDESRDPGGAFWTRGVGKKARACTEYIIAFLGV